MKDKKQIGKKMGHPFQTAVWGKSDLFWTDAPPPLQRTMRGSASPKGTENEVDRLIREAENRAKSACFRSRLLDF